MNKTVIGVIVGIVIIVLGVTVFWQFRDPNNTVEGQDTPTTTQDDANGRTITALHQFKNGTHTIAGEVDMPTPCHTLTTEAMIAESYPEQVSINFKSEAANDSICAQVITPKKFKIDFKASEQATIRASWNGEPVTLNLVPIGPNENIDTFELYIKA